MLTDWINPKYVDKDVQKLKRTFSLHKPFSYLELKNFLKEDKASQLLKAVLGQRFYPKQSDLFQFMQSEELVQSDNRTIKQFVSFLSSPEFVGYMKRLTNTKLNNKIDLFASLYQDTDFLLPHDDRLEGRKIAFMYYLSDLEKVDGGALLLYDEIPSKVVAKLIPKFNTFTFFVVSNKSYHSVEEVTAKKQRITLSGWFMK